MLKFVSLFSVCTFFLFSPPVYSVGLSGHYLYNFVKSELSIRGINSSPAIQKNRTFPDCQGTLVLNKMFGDFKTVKISCTTNDSWSLVVRSNAHLHPKAVTPFSTKKKEQPLIVTLNKSLQKGDIIRESDVSLTRANNNFGLGIFFNAQHLVGRKIKTSLSAGSVVRSRHLEKNWLINKNQKVSIQNQVGGILIKASGIAEESGRLGEKILVRNINSGKKILGWVESEKKVRINAKIN